MIWNFRKGDMFMTYGNGPIVIENAGTGRMIARDKNSETRIYAVKTGELMGKAAMSIKEREGWKVKCQMTHLNYPEYFV